MTTSRSSPLLQVGGRIALMVGAAAALAMFHPPHRPATLCLFRALTGVPCPLCGGTTAAVHVGNGRFGAAVGASPLLIFGAATLALWPLVPGVVVATAERFRNQLVFSLLAASELWQLHRFL